MTVKLAIICAANPGNAGMYSVDLAAYEFFSRHDIDFELFTSHAPSRFLRYKFLKIGIEIGHKKTKKFGKLKLKRYYDEKQLSSFTHVVFWGDFTPNPAYGFGDFHHVDKRYDVKCSEAESFDNWARLFNFSNGKIKPKVICIGNNFQHDFESEYEKYRPYLERLENLFDVIMPRDTYSTDNLKTIFKKKDKILQGLDPAFLLKKTNVLEHKAASNNSFAYFFSRSSLPDIQKIVEAVENKSGLKGIELSDWLNLDPDNAENVFSNFINIIANSAFVLTDLYHLSINTLRLNRPVICFGNETTEQTGTIGDFKKKVLFDMLAINHLYVELPSDPTRAFEIINNKLHDIISDPKLTLDINYEKIEILIDEFSAAILKQISSSA